MTDQPETRRYLVAFPHRGRGPRKIIIDYYDDQYTPLDVIAALIGWATADPERVEAFAAFVDEQEGQFTGEDARVHLNLAASMIVAIDTVCPHFDVHVIGDKGMVN